MPEYICLIQEKQFIKNNQNIYKIESTRKSYYNRIRNYMNGNLLFQMACEDCNKIENKAIILFKDKYKQKTKIGDRYFTGDHENMLYDIRNIIQCETEEQFTDDDDMMTRIQKTFPNYIQDECFGGSKKLIKIKIEEDIIKTYYIKHNELKEDILTKDWFKKHKKDKKDYISRLMINDVIKDNAIYDFNDTDFMNALDQHKEKVSIAFDENFTEEETQSIKKYNTRNDVEHKIDKILSYNCVFNDKIYCEIMFDIVKITFPSNGTMITKRIDTKPIEF